MSVTAVVGAQWGDEGKGRIVDYLAGAADVVIRFQGGDNAGHTVVNDLGTFKLHMIPSGIFSPRTICIVGTGTVCHPPALLEEMAEVRRAGVSLDNLRISERAQIVLPYHRQLDGLEETARGKKSIGTTKKGIGPAYADKAARYGVRMGDLLRPDYLRARLGQVVPRKNRLLAQFDQPAIDLDALVEEALSWGEALRPYIVDILPLVQHAVRRGQAVLLEGQLGAMRDLDWGIYPYVTSSNPLSGAATAGAGVPPTALTDVLGVVKAYSTAVGAGPLPTELEDEAGLQLRKVGVEFGATTGRPRRCGWLDIVAVRHSAWLNGFTGLALTKLDVLDGFDEIKIATAYRLDGQLLTHVPDTPDMERVEPVYESWPGWKSSTREARTWDALPEAARRYLERIAELVEVPHAFVSVGPERDELIDLRHPTD